MACTHETVIVHCIFNFVRNNFVDTGNCTIVGHNEIELRFTGAFSVTYRNDKSPDNLQRMAKGPTSSMQCSGSSQAAIWAMPFCWNCCLYSIYALSHTDANCWTHVSDFGTRTQLLSVLQSVPRLFSSQSVSSRSMTSIWSGETACTYIALKLLRQRLSLSLSLSLRS